MKFRRQGPFTQSLAPKIWLLHRRKKKQLFGHTFSDFSREQSWRGSQNRIEGFHHHLHWRLSTHQVRSLVYIWLLSFLCFVATWRTSESSFYWYSHLDEGFLNYCGLECSGGSRNFLEGVIKKVKLNKF